MPRALLRMLAVLLCFAQPAVVTAAYAAPSPLAYAVAAPTSLKAQDKDEKSCGRGAATKRFGWKVVDFGVSTLKYLIGLLIIPIGFFLVCIGAALELVEWVAC